MTARTYGRWLAVWLMFASPWNLLAHEARSPSVQIVSTIDTAGLVQKSPSYQITGFVGQPGAVASSPGGSYVVRQGPVGMVVHPEAFTVEAAEAEINEAGTAPEASTQVQLSGAVTNDDETIDPIPGAEVAWTPPAVGDALASISSSGVAVAPAVYEDTAVSFSGAFAGWTGTGVLLVKNVSDDNYGPLAGNGFDDSWEMGKGQTQGFDPEGVTRDMPNWAFYAMDLDPRVPHGDLFPAATHEGFLTISYRRNSRASGYRFVVEETQNLDAGFVQLTNPVSEVHADADGTETVTVRGSMPMDQANHQFMRVRVEKQTPGENPGPNP